MLKNYLFLLSVNEDVECDYEDFLFVGAKSFF